jgi:hypothetical protein
MDKSAEILAKIRSAREITVSPEELRAKVAKALADYHALDPELKEMVSGGEDEIIQATIAAHTIKAVPFTEPRAATRQEQEQLDREMFAKECLGDDAFADRPRGVTEQQMAAFRNGANRPMSPLQQIIDREVEKLLKAAQSGRPYRADVPDRPLAKRAVEEAEVDEEVDEEKVEQIRRALPPVPPHIAERWRKNGERYRRERGL